MAVPHHSPISRAASSPSTRPVGSRSKASLVPQDKGAVILDIGRVYTKIGVSGEPAPRYIIESNVLTKPLGEVLDVWDDKYLNREELYLILCRFLYKILLEYLMINPREYRVVIVESIVAPLNFRNLLAKALLIHFSVPHVCCLPHQLACLFTLGTSTALVIDIGLKETSIVPVYEGVPLIKSIVHTSTATNSIYSSLQSSLMEHGSVENRITQETKPFSSCDDRDIKLTSSLMANIIVKTCFIRPLSKGDAVPPTVHYPINGQSTLIIPGIVRSTTTDVLFEGSSLGQSLPVCILDSLLLCPVDCRAKLCENIIIVGGNASLPGLNYRLKEELVGLYKEQQYECLSSLNFKFHTLTSHPSYTAWQGASIFGAIESAVIERSVTKESFKSLKYQLPDWMSCNSTQWECLKPVSPRKISSPVHQRRHKPSIPFSSSFDKSPSITDKPVDIKLLVDKS